MMKKMVLLSMTCMLAVILAGCMGSRAFQRGEHYAKHGEWDLAVKEFREANQREPQDIEYRSALLRAQETAANHHYKKARNFLKERKLDQAIVELQQALYLNPSNAAIQSALNSVLDMKQAEEHYGASLKFKELGRLADAVKEMGQAVDRDPENVKYQGALEKLRQERSEVEPEDALSLASDKPISLSFKNTNIKDVFEFLSKLSGINILFDEEVKSQPVTVFVKNVSLEYALNLLLSTNKLFMKKISSDTIIIIPKNKAKMDQYQELKVKTFYLNNAKAKEAVNLLRSMLDVKKVYVNDILNSITVRDTPEKLMLVEKVLAANDLKEAEVILDVEILEIARTNTLQYGWHFTPNLSTTASIQGASGTSGTSSSTAGVSLTELSKLTKSNIFFTLPSVVVNLIKQDADAQTLANPRVRVMTNKPAKFHIGDKIPVQTSTLTSTQTLAVTSTFDYKDVGIKLNIEPTVHINNTVTLKLTMEISTLGQPLDFGNGQKQYTFGTRNTETLINLRDGEAVIIGGMIKDEERKSKIKIPLLGDIPVLGRLFSSTDDQAIKTDILMSITPNIVRSMELPDKETQAFWSGTEETYGTKPLFDATKGKKPQPSKRQPDKTAVLESMSKREPAPGSVTMTPAKPVLTPPMVSRPSTTSLIQAPGALAAPMSSPTTTGRSSVMPSAAAPGPATKLAPASSMTSQPAVAPAAPVIAAMPLSAPSTTSRPSAAVPTTPAPVVTSGPQSAPSTTGRPLVAPPVLIPGEVKNAAPAPSSEEQSPIAASNPVLEIRPSEGSMQIAQETRFDLFAGSMKDLYGAIITLSYDPKVVEFRVAVEGAFLKKDGQQTSFLFSNNVKTGIVDIYMTRIGNVGGTNGTGNLCAIVLQGKSGGTSDIPIRSVKLTNFKREQIKAEISGAKVIVK